MTIWSRAVTSNYLRLLAACFLGSIIGTSVVLYLPSVPSTSVKAMTCLYAIVPFMMISAVRLVRPIVRDLFYTRLPALRHG